MDHSALLIFHITAGGFGLVLGATALLARKGARLHRMAGNAFFISMLLMAISGMCLAVLIPAAAKLNGVVSAVTLYLVATSWVTVLRKESESGAFEMGALLAALAIAAAGLSFGVAAADSATGTLDGIPAAAYFPFGAVALVAAALDVSVIARGGVSGAQRVARHLWRMCFALLIAAFAFFIGQAAVLPTWVRETRTFYAPVIVILLLTVFWLLRVLLTNWYKGPTQIVQTASRSRQ